MGLFSPYPIRYRDRATLLQLLWKPVLIVLAIGWVVSRYPGHETAVIVGGVLAYLVWLVLAGVLRRRGSYWKR